MTSSKKGGEEVYDSIVFKQQIYCLFLLSASVSEIAILTSYYMYVQNEK